VQQTISLKTDKNSGAFMQGKSGRRKLDLSSRAFSDLLKIGGQAWKMLNRYDKE